MRLKSIKLSGFKSFVDPTTVPFPSNMAAIVGPNGCGKSNIIDAVRWVMGESSAKYLRGESMTDVIFNGSSSRKPVGQANIELIFDNHDGKAPGEYAAYSEISVRRRVSRDGQSEYFLNGTRCRRKDITDLFLGTGLGPRSYAIIEQGMISRLIEAKPEELRVYIEEAAGISKYKERRKETESRMKRTQENLERLTDLREELERQLQHLHRQSQSAEKYKAYKQEERTRRAELTALRWQNLDVALQQGRERVRDTELLLEKGLTDRVSLDTDMERYRDQHLERTDHFNKAQVRFYGAGADIARVEQSLQHLGERARQLTLELEQALAGQRELALELERDAHQLDILQEELAIAEPTLEETNALAEESSGQLAEVELHMQDWQQRWDQFSQRSSDARQRAEIEQSRIRSAEENIRRLEERRVRLRDEQVLLKGQMEPDELELLREDLAVAEETRDGCQEIMQREADLILVLRNDISELDTDIAKLREALQTAKGQLASHQAMLEDQLGDKDQRLQRWLAQQGLQDCPRLLHQLKVQSGWEVALEVVLGNFAQALCLDRSDLQFCAGSVPAGVSMVFPITEPPDVAGASQPGLQPLVEGADAFADMLAAIRPVNSLDEALQYQAGLRNGESLVTPAGVWLGRNWIRYPKNAAGQTGVIERQRMITGLSLRIESLTETLAANSDRMSSLKARLQLVEQERENLRQQASAAEQQLSVLRARLGALEARAEQIGVRLSRLVDDLAEVDEQMRSEQEQLGEARMIWQQAMTDMDRNADERETLQLQRDSLRERLDDLRQRARHERDQAHQLQLQVQALRGQSESLKQTRDRLLIQHERIEERIEVLQEGREGALIPQEDLQMQLEGLLETRMLEEDRLVTAREALEEIDRSVREIEHARSRTEQGVQAVRTSLERYKMDAQALEIRCATHLEQLQELGVALKEVLENMPPEAAESVWETELEALSARIQRLGAINLAAIDEYRVQGERKEYLDAQHADLIEALEMLDNAIRKIDRETRARFKETFDQVNGGLQALFPKVFGGGHAYLDLTGEDLLETGVSIMARPPGKKNSTIHLLSGGEKALTAIALVFSIFQLNPAPFCMLDEVDAPLDDANVGRYARLVKEMSSHLQFIYITHNKIAMEQADQLMGVTMHEPGVSRLVSVNVEEAVALAAV